MKAEDIEQELKEQKKEIEKLKKKAKRQNWINLFLIMNS